MRRRGRFSRAGGCDLLITPPKVGVVILNHNSCAEVIKCLDAVRRAQGGDKRVYIVDNASSDASSAEIPPRLRGAEEWVPSGDNLGFSGGNNIGIRKAMEWGADYLLILNPDCVVEPDFLPHLIRALEAQPRAGIACPKVLQVEGNSLQSLGGDTSLWTGRCSRRLLGAREGEGRARSWSRVDFPPGACMLIKRELLEDIGLLNEAYFLYYEDVEIGLRARRELWEILAIPQSVARHCDTTEKKFGDPVTSYHGTRNQCWVIAEYGSLPQRLSFLLLSLSVRWPFRFASRLFRGHLRACWAIVRGAFAGVFSRKWTRGNHLATPFRGRRVKYDDTV